MISSHVGTVAQSEKAVLDSSSEPKHDEPVQECPCGSGEPRHSCQSFPGYCGAQADPDADEIDREWVLCGCGHYRENCQCVGGVW